MVVVVLVVATLFHGMFGFGTGLISMPLLTLLIGVQDAAVLTAFVILGTTTVVLGRDWRSLQGRAALSLVAGSLPGVAVGIWLLTEAPDVLVQRGLGLLLVGYALYRLFSPPLLAVSHPAWAYPFGFAGGVLAAVYNANSPPVVIYAVLRRWPPAVFRATLQAYFVPMAAIVWLGHGLAGLWTPAIVATYLIFLPAGLAALWAGSYLAARLPAGSFQRVVYLALLPVGLLLLL